MFTFFDLFSKKEKKPSPHQIDIQRIEDFSKECDGQFEYLGVKHIITGSEKWIPRIGTVPRLRCHVQREGQIYVVWYTLHEMEIIKKFYKKV